MSHGFDDFKNMIEMYSKAEADLLLADKANTASPTFTGTPKAPTPANTSNNTTIATTAFVRNLLNVIYPVGASRVLNSIPGGATAMHTFTDVIGTWHYESFTITLHSGMGDYTENHYFCTRTS